MLHPLAGISRGDVLACGASVFVVHDAGPDGIVQLLRAMTPRDSIHRSDVRPDHWSDMAEAGLPLQDLVIRCVVVTRENPSGFARLGRVSKTLQARLAAAVARELEARRFEDTPSVRSTLLAIGGGVGSRGRQVGRRNAT